MIELGHYPEAPVYPTHRGRLIFQLDRLTYRWSDDTMWHTECAGRSRLVIEGEDEFMERITAALGPTLDQIQAEIG